MRALLFSLFVMLFSPLPTLAAPTAGDMAPDFAALDSYGNEVVLANKRGKYVVLEWTNHQCPFVEKHYDTNNMQDLQRELTGKGAVWLTMISSAPGKQGHVDGNKANEIVLRQNSAASHVLLDESGTVGKLYGARTTPQMVLINPEGMIIYAGAIDSISSADKSDVRKATNYVRTAFNEALEGKPVTTPTSTPYGCSVKYE